MTADAKTTPPLPSGRGARWSAGRIVLVVPGSIIALLGVAAYVSLMRDEYPPFRLDMGPSEPAEPAEAPPPAT